MARLSILERVQRASCMKQFLALIFLAALSLSGCTGSDPIVVIQLHPTNPDILYIATNDYIYKSRDGGKTWSNLSKGMSHSRVIAMAVDPAYPATIYAGTKGDAVYKSYDGGAALDVHAWWARRCHDFLSREPICLRPRRRYPYLSGYDHGGVRIEECR